MYVFEYPKGLSEYISLEGNLAFEISFPCSSEGILKVRNLYAWRDCSLSVNTFVQVLTDIWA